MHMKRDCVLNYCLGQEKYLAYIIFWKFPRLLNWLLIQKTDKGLTNNFAASKKPS